MRARRAVIAAVVAPLLAVPVTAQASATAPVEASPPGTGAARQAPPASQGTQFVELKLREAAALTLQGQRFVAPTAATGVRLTRSLADAGVESVAPLFAGPPAKLQRQAQQLRSAGHSAPDLSQWYRLTFPSAAAARSAVPRLSALSSVVDAYVAPAPPPPPATPDYESQQGYRTPSPTGIGATAVASVPGADGSEVRVVDIEYAWNLQHEDLGLPSSALIPSGSPCDPFSDNNHGTAVLGELAAQDNGFGVTGLVPAAQIGVTNAAQDVDGWCTWAPANAVATAAAALEPGDVILIEQQTPAPNGQYVPLEWVSSAYDAIKTATSQGIIVVEAAGNGGQNLDDTATFGDPFPAGKADSGAIIVGAANSCSGNPLSRASFSTYGSRVNLQGWGGCVTTTGYGSLFGADANTYYTAAFNGTSSASPIVAAAAASLSSARQAAGGSAYTPRKVRQILMDTGTPQQLDGGVLGGNIGPMPDLAAAFDAIPTVVSATPPEKLKASPFVVTFDRPVKGVTTSRLKVVQVGPANVTGTVSCLDDSDAAVSCADGPVTTALFTPKSPLIAGEYYFVNVNRPSAGIVGYSDGVPVLPSQTYVRAQTAFTAFDYPVTYKWAPVINANALGGSYLRDGSGGATAKVPVTLDSRSTPSLVLWGGPAQGIASVAVTKKGSPVASFDVDTYRPKGRQLNTSLGELRAGTYQVTVTVTGTKNASSSGTFIGIDGVVANGTTTVTPKLVPMWPNFPGEYAYDYTKGTSVSLTFRGTGIDWQALVGPNNGYAKVTIDGVVVDAARDLYAPGYDWQTISYGGLSASGYHTIVITTLGTKQAASTDTVITLRHLIVQ